MQASSASFDQSRLAGLELFVWKKYQQREPEHR